MLPKATLEARVAPRQKGMQVMEILSVDETAPQKPTRRSRPERAQRSSDQAAVEEIGTATWYKCENGLGFIVRHRGGRDIFVHGSALNRSGIGDLAKGRRVAVDMVEGHKGPEAVGVRLI